MSDVMPVFVIKARDALAIPALDAYLRECMEHRLYNQAASVRKAIQEISDWQQRNIDATKLPNHSHVAAGKPGSGSEVAS